MTMLTHRATPSCLPVRKSLTFEEQMARPSTLEKMLADAKAIKRRTQDGTFRENPVDIVPEEVILEYVKAHPGCTAAQIAEGVGRSAKTMSARLSYMENRKQVRAVFVVNPKGRGKVREFYPVANPPKAKNGRPKGPQAQCRPSPVRDKMVAFIRANPGCTTHQVADHMGCSVKVTGAAINDARRTVKIHSERVEGGNHTPARHWVIE